MHNDLPIYEQQNYYIQHKHMLVYQSYTRMRCVYGISILRAINNKNIFNQLEIRI